MGKLGGILMGESKQKGNINLLSPEQQNFLSSMLGSGQQDAQGALGGLLQPQGFDQANDAFQQRMIDPAMQALQQQLLPAIQERFGGENASSSSALNQALSGTASDLATQLGSQFGQFYQGEAQRGMQGQLGGLGFLQGMQQQSTFQPHIQQKSGILGPTVNAFSAYAGMPSKPK